MPSRPKHTLLHPTLPSIRLMVRRPRADTRQPTQQAARSTVARFGRTKRDTRLAAPYSQPSGLGHRPTIPSGPIPAHGAVPAQTHRIGAPCARAGCPCDAYDGRSGSDCCQLCRGGQRCALRCHIRSRPDRPFAERCARNGCPCDAHGGVAVSHCSKGCRDGGAPCKFAVHKHVPQQLQDNIATTASAEAITPMDARFQERHVHFVETWNKAKGPVPKVVKLFALQAPRAVCDRHLRAKQCMQGRGQSPNERTLFHGLCVAPTCTLFSASTCCSNPPCGLCGITCNGFDPQRIGSGVLSQQMAPGHGFKRFGHGFYFAYNSCKSHDYAFPHPFKCNGDAMFCMIICVVAMGNVFKMQRGDASLQSAPPGYDSVVGEVGADLNYPEAVVYAADRAVPTFAVFYKMQ